MEIIIDSINVRVDAGDRDEYMIADEIKQALSKAVEILMDSDIAESRPGHSVTIDLADIDWDHGKDNSQKIARMIMEAL